MKNEIYERDYRRAATDKSGDTASSLPEILDYSVKSGLFKAYQEAWSQIPRYIVQENKIIYEDLLSRLDAYAERLQGKIKGVVDYEQWQAHITVELPHFEACNPEEFSLLSDIVSKAANVTFQASGNGGIELRVRFHYFEELEDTGNILNECIMKDKKLVEMLMDSYKQRRAVVLSSPKLRARLEDIGSKMGMTAEEVYDWITENSGSEPDPYLNILFNSYTDGESKEENKDENKDENKEENKEPEP